MNNNNRGIPQLNMNLIHSTSANSNANNTNSNVNNTSISNILGNLTYSSYLLHLPTQILIFILLPENLISDYAYNNYFFISYMFFILVISFISYKYFEDPMRVYIRNKIS